MEHSQHGLLEELVAPRSQNWTKFPHIGENDRHLFLSGWSYQTLDLSPSNTSFSELINPPVEFPEFSCPFNEIYPFVYPSSMDIDSPCIIGNEITHPFPVPYGDFDVFGNDFQNFHERNSSSSKDEEQASLDIPVFSVGSFEAKSSKSKKVGGQPSKNLMAERRRRKRLNDRLSMLRSVVPKISKMDRTSILGDTIDYMKELLEKIHKLQGNNTGKDRNQINLVGNLKEQNVNEAKNPNKVDVERMDKGTRIEMSCTSKPGLLLSAVNTIEELGLDIQQCVISCLDNFSLQASCSEAMEHRTIISCEDLKQALHINAGYGGTC